MSKGLQALFDTAKRGGHVIRPLEMYLLKSQNEDNDRAFNVNAPSSIGKCLRARYYSRTGAVKVKNDAKSMRIFGNGHKVHDRLQECLINAGILLMSEVPVLHSDLLIQGHTDGILKLSDSELGVLEIKSINQRQFEELKREKDEHREQGLSYLFCIEQRWKELKDKYKNAWDFAKSRKARRKYYAKFYQHLKGGSKHTRQEKIDFQVDLHMKLDSLLFRCDKPITKVVFLYENKNTQELKEYTVSSEDKGAEKVINRIIDECFYVNECVETGEVPNRCTTSKSSQVCRFCDYRNECWIL